MREFSSTDKTILVREETVNQWGFAGSCGYSSKLTWRAPCTQRNMAATYWVKSLLVIFLTVHFANGLYFHMGETEKKCFIEEIPDETMVIGRFFSFICPLKD